MLQETYSLGWHFANPESSSEFEAKFNEFIQNSAHFQDLRADWFGAFFTLLISITSVGPVQSQFGLGNVYVQFFEETNMPSIWSESSLGTLCFVLKMIELGSFLYSHFNLTDDFDEKSESDHQKALQDISFKSPGEGSVTSATSSSKSTAVLTISSSEDNSAINQELVSLPDHSGCPNRTY